MADARPTAAATSSRLFQAMAAPDREAVLAAGAHRSLRKGQVLLRQGSREHVLPDAARLPC
jgi:hypothetical protein